MTTDPNTLPPQDGLEPEAHADNTTQNVVHPDVAGWQDKALRAAADLENFRKRSAGEVADAKAYALTGFARDLLPVADNLARALEAPQGNEAALREGVKMVADQLLSVFARHGVVPVEVTPGAALNPEQHQPMLEVPSEHPRGHVVAAMQAGYTLNGRLIRPAFVSVAAAKQ